MDGGEASTKRPLLEDDVMPEVHLPSIARGSAPCVTDPVGESSSLLEDGAAGSQVLIHDSSGQDVGRSRKSAPGEVHQSIEFQEHRATAAAALTSPGPCATQDHHACAGRHDRADNAESFREAITIEMQDLSEDTDGCRELLPVVSASCSASSDAQRQGDDRNCFICLQDGDKDNPLISCCSTCYATTHRRCWREWRSNQQRSALRSRLLGTRMQTTHMLRCTICKSGTALVEGEESGLSWMSELMCGGEPSENSLLGRLAAVGARRDDSDEDADAQLEDLIDTRTCAALVIYLCMLIVVVIVACLLIVTQRFWAGDVVLCCIIGLYQLSVFLLVILAVLRRRGAVLAAASTRTASSLEPSGRELPLHSV